jgi:hypothetical protein
MVIVLSNFKQKSKKSINLGFLCACGARAGGGGIKENAEKKNKKNYLVKPNQ